MCGLFGYIGAGPPDQALLKHLGALAERRGPHAWGVAWRDGSGRQSTWREPLTLSRSRWDWSALGDASAVIGHCRLSTSGTPRDNANNQPIASARVAIAHNGNVYGHEALAKIHRLPLVTSNDSELVLRALDGDGALEPRAARTIGLLGSTPYAVLALLPDTVLAARLGQPLYVVHKPHAFYFCSAPMPGGELIAERSFIRYTRGAPMPTESLKATPRVHPISLVRWVDPTTLHANSYNPNRVFSPELKLLKRHILTVGWTQPIVARPNGEIVDGFHRWNLCLHDAEIRAETGGLAPVVFADVDEATQIVSTVAHNRARGQHGVLKMGDIIRRLLELKRTPAEICAELGMDDEEFARLADMRGSPDIVGKESFGKGWVPAVPEGETGKGNHLDAIAARKKVK